MGELVEYYSKKFSDNYWQFIIDNPDKDWNWNLISENPNITWEIIQNNSDKPWSRNKILSNKNITWEIIQNNFDKKWCWKYISIN